MIKPQLFLFFLGQPQRHDAVGLTHIGLQVLVLEAGLLVILDPGHAPRGKIRRWSQTRLFFQHLKTDLAHLERNRRLPAPPATDRKNLAADLPDMGPAPLHNIGRSRECLAEPVELFVGQGAAFA